MARPGRRHGPRSSDSKDRKDSRPSPSTSRKTSTDRTREVADRKTSAVAGSPPNSAGLYLNSRTFVSLARRQLSVEKAINTGRLLVSEVDEKILNLEDILQQVTSSEQDAQANSSDTTT